MLAILQRRLAWQWWRHLLVLLVLFFAAGQVKLSSVLQQEPRGLIFFALSLLSIFASRKHFHQFKQSVISLGKEPQRLLEIGLWQDYFLVRQKALWFASMPTYCAVIGATLGLESIAKALLLLCSLLLFWLYRTPRQVWYVPAAV